jgi:hypothetical protein
MQLRRQVRPAPIRVRPRTVITSLITGLLLMVVGAGPALAGPAPLDEGPGPAEGGGGPISVTDSGIDWTPWLWSALILLVVVGLASIAATRVQHRHHPASA